MYQNLYPRFWNRVILIMVILVCSTAGQTGSMPGTPTSLSPKGTGGTGGLSPPDVDSTDSNAEPLATTSLPSLVLSCFVYMFLQLWWCMDDLVRFSRALRCIIAWWCKRHHHSFVSANWLVGGRHCNLPFKWKARARQLHSLNSLCFFWSEKSSCCFFPLGDLILFCWRSQFPLFDLSLVFVLKFQDTC